MHVFILAFDLDSMPVDDNLEGMCQDFCAEV